MTGSTTIMPRALRAALFTSTLLASGIASAAFAQITPPPVRSAVDTNGVNVISGSISVAQSEMSIGADARQGIFYRRTNNGTGWWNNLIGTIDQQGIAFTVSFDGFTDRFLQSGSNYNPTEVNGATLTKSGSTYTYTGRDGTVATFTAQGDKFQSYSGNAARLSTITYPNGTKLTFGYDVVSYCVGGIEEGQCPGGIAKLARLSSVDHSNGYRILLTYLVTNFSEPDEQAWLTVQTVKAINRAVETCSPSCTNSWPTVSYSSSFVSPNWQHTVTDAGGQQTRYTNDTNGKLVAIKRPGASSDNVQISYSSGRVSSITADGLTFGYAYSDSGSTRTTTVTAPDSSQKVYTSNMTLGRVLTYRDELNRTTTYTYDSDGRLTRATYPEGNYVNYTYDGRGNVTESRRVAKSGSGLSDIVTQASFSGSCSNAKTCNQPVTTTDALGKVTDYTYNATHGGVETVTLPAATSGGTRPKWRDSYSGLTAYFKDSGGSIVSSGQTTYLLTQTATCQTTASCTNGADEVKAVASYGPQTPGVANNLLPVSVTSGTGDGSLSAAVVLTYDSIGNRLTVDGPLSGTADTTKYRYDASRQIVGIVGPDPDGGSSRVPLAQKITYNADGQVTATELGTVADHSDIEWAAFSSQQQVVTTYDANARPVKSEVKSGATTYAVEQSNYDSMGRVNCVATRMDSAQWASQTDACVPQTSNTITGPDRVAKASYTTAGEVSQVQLAYGTTGVVTEATKTYSSNGKLVTIKDAENNLTTYTYDGHDRLWQTRYPSTTKGANASNASDYEQLTYDARDNVTLRRLRDGTTIGYSYNDLGRLTTKDLPGSESDVAYSYDLLGRSTSVVQGSLTNSFVHDAFGRITSQTAPLGTVGYTYDAAGRRIAMSYPGGVLSINYDYDVAGNITAIRENGATSGVGVLASYAFDGVGRRSSVTFGNGSVQSFTYDPISRLATLTNNLGGSATTHDLTQTLTYNAASQIVTNVRSNDAYAWGAHYNADRTYAMDGLNRIASVGAANFTYDTRGNLTSDGTNSFTYTAENLLKTAPGSATLAYDPLGRLHEAVKSASTTRFLYDGTDMVGEYNGSNTIQRRYVHGPGVDNPIVWYEGSAINNTTRRFLMADERGSVVSVTDSAGATVGLNSYEEQGIPGTGNVGKFGYTGQLWVPELGMWYYKARVYSPTLGRFMQTDPIGYAGGMNLYNYVRSDPVNGSDPSGLCDPKRDCPRPAGFDLDYAALADRQYNNSIDVWGTRSGHPDPTSVYAAVGPNANGVGHNGGYDGEAIDVFGTRAVKRPAGRGFAPAAAAPQNNGCGSSPNVLSISAKSGVLGAMGGAVDLKGTLTDVLTGREWSFQTPITGALAVGIGVFTLSGTLATNPEKFNQGISVEFVSIGAFGFGIIGSAYVTDADGNKIGELNVGGLTPGIASVGVDFERTNVVQTSKGICP